MKVTLKEPYEAEQFDPRNNIPSCVVDLLRVNGYTALKIKGYEWGVSFVECKTIGIHIGDWVVTYGENVFVYTNERFRRDFKEVDNETR